MSVIFSSMTFFSIHNLVLWVIEWCPVSLISLMVLFTLMTSPYGYTMGHDSLSMYKNGQKLLEFMFFGIGPKVVEALSSHMDVHFVHPSVHPSIPLLLPQCCHTDGMNVHM
jgi:hypothetical protein